MTNKPMTLEEMILRRLQKLRGLHEFLLKEESDIESNDFYFGKGRLYELQSEISFLESLNIIEAKEK